MGLTSVFSGRSLKMVEFEKIKDALEKGDFSRLQDMLGGPEGFDRCMIEAHSNGEFTKEPDSLNEAFACACMLGRIETVKYLLTQGVDPYAGMKTWLAGPHWAVSGGHLTIVQLLLDNNISLELKNGYGGTLLGQALWSIVEEPKPDHALIIEALINAGSVIEPGTLEWWRDQKIPSADVKERVANALDR